jgi:hypothetical protein
MLLSMPCISGEVRRHLELGKNNTMCRSTSTGITAKEGLLLSPFDVCSADVLG